MSQYEDALQSEYAFLFGCKGRGLFLVFMGALNYGIQVGRHYISYRPSV
jgi:hypothetical protein